MLPVSHLLDSSYSKHDLSYSILDLSHHVHHRGTNLSFQKDDSSGDVSHLQDRVSNLEKQNADLINNLASANKIANEERVRAEREAEKAEIERVKCGEIRDRSSQERVLMDADRRRLEKFERTNRDLLTEKQKVDQTNVQLQEVHNMMWFILSYVTSL